MSLANMVSQDVFTAQYNPADLKRIVGVAYARLGVLGYSSETLQYQFRNNEKLTFTLLFDTLSQTGGTSSAFLVQSILDAMTVGSQAAQDTASGGPPDVLFLWPGVLQFIVRVTKIEYSYTRFAFADGTPTYFGAKVEVEESRTNRLFAEQIRQSGLMRGGS
jgi:Contractile injection system tube protein